MEGKRQKGRPWNAGMSSKEQAQVKDLAARTYLVGRETAVEVAARFGMSDNGLRNVVQEFCREKNPRLFREMKEAGKSSAHLLRVNARQFLASSEAGGEREAQLPLVGGISVPLAHYEVLQTHCRKQDERLHSLCAAGFWTRLKFLFTGIKVPA